MCTDQENRWVTVFVGLGSNLGDRASNIQRALLLLQESGHFRLARTSSFYDTEPVGPPASPAGGPQPVYLNGVAEGQSDLPAEALLALLKETERALGRRESVPWGPREVDLDLLFYGKETVQTKQLTVPHPRLPEREFVLTPLSEIAPQWVHPTLHQTNLELLEQLYFHENSQRTCRDAEVEPVGSPAGPDHRLRPDDGGPS